MLETSRESARVCGVVEFLVRGTDLSPGWLDTTSCVQSLADLRSFVVTSIACRCGTIIGARDHEISAQ